MSASSSLPKFVDVLRGLLLGLVDFHVLFFAEPGRVSVDTCVEIKILRRVRAESYMLCLASFFRAASARGGGVTF